MYAVNVMTADLILRYRLLLPGLCLIYCCLAPVMIRAEEEARVAVEVIAILNTDEQGKRLRYPSSVTYDREMDETYVVAGGEGKVIIYGSNFFPTIALSKGRNGDAPRGVYVDASGMIYLCQGRTEDKPGRITSFNAAFFPQKVIVFSSMPEGENFVPKSMVTGLTGTMYVVGQNSRGVLVLDSEGKFSHWLKPMDLLFTESPEQESLMIGPEESGTGVTSEVAASPEADPEKIDMRDLLPPDLLPTVEEGKTTAAVSEPQPVQVADIKVDSSGRLYVLSEETSKTYVYSKEEELLFSFGQKGGSTGKMSRPRSLVIDEKKNAIYIVDYMRHTILIFDLSGRFMYEFGGMGTGPGWFQFPVGLALNGEGNLIVADLFNQRVQVLDIKFEYKYPLSGLPDQEQDVLPDQEEKPEPDATREDDDTLYLPLPLYL